jgi:hypothetical protein
MSVILQLVVVVVMQEMCVGVLFYVVRGVGSCLQRMSLFEAVDSDGKFTKASRRVLRLGRGETDEVEQPGWKPAECEGKTEVGGTKQKALVVEGESRERRGREAEYSSRDWRNGPARVCDSNDEGRNGKKAFRRRLWALATRWMCVREGQ